MWFVVTQNPANGHLIVIHDDDDDENVLTFDSEEAARDMADRQFLCETWGYEVYEWVGA